ncbi:MAG: helix-turn-helix transcriptional regulator [Planctomycetota bacterium]
MSPQLPAAGPDASGTRATASPVLLDIEGFAGVLGVSSRHLRRMVDAGKAPQPVRLGGCVRWHRQAVDAWLAAGCPNCRKRPGVAR